MIYSLCLSQKKLRDLYQNAEEENTDDDTLESVFGRPPYHYLGQGTFREKGDEAAENDTRNLAPIYRSFGRSNIKVKGYANIIKQLPEWMREEIGDGPFGPFIDDLKRQYKGENDTEEYLWSIRLPRREFKKGAGKRKRDTPFPEIGEVLNLWRGIDNVITVVVDIGNTRVSTGLLYLEKK